VLQLTLAAENLLGRNLSNITQHTVFNNPFFLRNTTLFTVYNGGGEEQKCRNGKRETVNL